MSAKPEQHTILAVDPRRGSIGVGRKFGFMEKCKVTEADRRRHRGALPLAWRLVIQGPLAEAPPDRIFAWAADAPDIAEMKGYAATVRGARRGAMDALKAAERRRRGDSR